ncbi:MAG TPA: hypothetical protein VJ023_01980 [Pyrinomonadaceae bacterium]|nr:hypothetical protein [Pyrinomonadaceae bacterium]
MKTLIWVTRLTIAGLVVLLLMPVTALSQGRDRGRADNGQNWKCRIFVNCHDASDGRWDGRGPGRDDDVFDRRGRRGRYRNRRSDDDDRGPLSRYRNRRNRDGDDDRGNRSGRYRNRRSDDDGRDYRSPRRNRRSQDDGVVRNRRVRDR